MLETLLVVFQPPGALIRKLMLELGEFTFTDSLLPLLVLLLSSQLDEQLLFEYTYRLPLPLPPEVVTVTDSAAPRSTRKHCDQLPVVMDETVPWLNNFVARACL
ncbi:hypothetical protein D3C71_1226450 [compost metagenome]